MYMLAVVPPWGEVMEIFLKRKSPGWALRIRIVRKLTLRLQTMPKGWSSQSPGGKYPSPADPPLPIGGWSQQP
jgi:hypothetical protein